MDDRRLPRGRIPLRGEDSGGSRANTQGMSSTPIVFDGARAARAGADGLNWGLIAVLLGSMAFWAAVALGVVALV